MANPNLQLLTDAAKLLEPILGELVFVGGCATALLITDNAAADVRPTFDVDAIAEITSYAAYAEFSERLRKLGFQEDTSDRVGGAGLVACARSDVAIPMKNTRLTMNDVFRAEILMFAST